VGTHESAAREPDAPAAAHALPVPATSWAPPALGATLTQSVVVALQRSAGNALVSRFLADTGAIGGTRWLARVGINGKETKKDPHNQKIFADALDAILECQNGLLSDPESWVSWATEINTELQTNGVSAQALQEIEAFYAQAEELSFFSNPILSEAWRRCMAATRDNSKYASVGGKFARKLPEVLSEIAADFPALHAKCGQVIITNINKEHQINKGKKYGGAQTAASNLQYAGTPPSASKASLSDFHKQLHALKSGTGHLDFNALDPAIQVVISKAQSLYSPDAMGKFNF
jgi:hypothetical protein